MTPIASSGGEPWQTIGVRPHVPPPTRARKAHHRGSAGCAASSEARHVVSRCATEAAGAVAESPRPGVQPGMRPTGRGCPFRGTVGGAVGPGAAKNRNPGTVNGSGVPVANWTARPPGRAYQWGTGAGGSKTRASTTQGYHLGITWNLATTKIPLRCGCRCWFCCWGLRSLRLLSSTANGCAGVN